MPDTVVPLYIQTKYISVGCLKREFDFPYSDDFFDKPSTEFNLKLAKSSLGLAVSADRDPDLAVTDQHREVEHFLLTAGFSRLRFFRYNVVPYRETAALAIGSKEIKGQTFAAITICGNGYGEEWIGNLKTGSGTTHLGFKTACDCVLSDIRTYIRDLDTDCKPVKIWAAGYSRASAILSLALSELLGEELCSEVYAYLFATPNNIRNPKRTPGIFNIMNPDDPFTKINPKGFCYGKNGTAVYLQTEQSTISNHFELQNAHGGNLYQLEQDSISNHSEPQKKHDGGKYQSKYQAEQIILGSHNFLQRLEALSHELGCNVYRESPQINAVLNRVLDYGNELLQSLSDYEKVMEKPLINLYLNHSKTVLFETYKQIKRNVNKYLPKERMKIFRQMRSYILKQALAFRRTRTKLIQIGEWSKADRLDTNILREHAGDTYVLRLFAMDD